MCAGHIRLFGFGIKRLLTPERGIDVSDCLTHFYQTIVVVVLAYVWGCRIKHPKIS